VARGSLDAAANMAKTYLAGIQNYTNGLVILQKNISKALDNL
jgi:hypothetical protein